MSNAQPITETERLNRLRLMRTRRVGPMTYRKLIERYQSASVALAELPRMSKAAGGRNYSIYSQAKAEEELTRLRAIGGQFVTFDEAVYPAALKMVEDAPPGLSVLGQPAVLTTDMVAIVGARNASASGRRFARELAADLGAAGYVVASGLARGIDRAAHVGALKTGTVAVLAGGVDVAYPEENQDAYDQIRERGVLISEITLGTYPTAKHFPRRNRIISGICHGVIIVEAAERSGSLITARLAAEQGREVMCVPGSPRDPRARGPNRLIREGATLVQNADDVLEALRPLADGVRPAAIVGAQNLPPPATALPSAAVAAGDTPGNNVLPGNDSPRAAVTECLSPSGITIDEIVRATNLTAAKVQEVLLELELAGHVERQPGGKVAAI